jgi:flagellar hook-basal body complex protein FliE
MNPLSAIQSFLTPEARGLPRAPVTPSHIPPAQLRELPLAAQSIPSAERAQGSFNSLLGSFVGEVNSRQVAAGEAVNGLLSGQPVPLHQAMVAMEEASLSFQLMVEVRNKLLEAYQELMRMQV